MAAALLPKLVADSRSSTNFSLDAQPCSACGRGEQHRQVVQHIETGCYAGLQACKCCNPPAQAHAIGALQG